MEGDGGVMKELKENVKSVNEMNEGVIERWK